MISLAMIVRDEAARLPSCLASAAPAVDEIVVVDTGSADGTPEIARAHGARVVVWPWRDDFAAARNESLRHARGDWVLVLDADERLAPGAAAHVRRLVAEGTVDGVDCRLVSTLPAGGLATTVAHWYCRLFRRRPGVQFAGRVHEQVAPSIHALGGRIVRSDIVILHDGYAVPDGTKLARNLALLRATLAERPEDAFALFNLGLTLHALGDAPAAADALQRALASPTAPLARELRAMAWSTLAELHARREQWDAAAAAAEQALAHEPDLAVARYVLGRARFARGALAEAARLFDALADAPADALGMRLAPTAVAVARAVVRLRRRQWAAAASLLEPVASLDPTGEAAFHLGNAYLGLGRLAAAADAYALARRRGVRDPALARRLALLARLGHRTTAAAGG